MNLQRTSAVVFWCTECVNDRMCRMERTIFHRILDREVPAAIVFEDDDVLAFNDIHPQAPTHVLFIPKVYVESIAHCTGEHAGIPGMLIERARTFAVLHGMGGYKLQFNVGKHGGQEVPYLHLHFLSTQPLREE